MIRNLAYIGLLSPNVEEWRSFGPDVLGAQLGADAGEGVVRLRVDDAAWRIAVHPGDHHDLAYLGWEVDDVTATVAAVEEAGIPVDGNAFVDPFGFRHELVTRLDRGDPFRPGRPLAGFVTGEQGLGHVVLIVPDLDAAELFYAGVLGFRPSDTIEMGITVRFFHCAGRAARHHTLAVSAVPGMVGLHHLMLEVASIDDVGTALDIVNQRRIPLAMSLGRHTNDLMTSFYVRSPSGFEIEYGTGGRTIDDDNWQVGSYDAMSLWGHKPPVGGGLPPGVLRPFRPAGSAPEAPLGSESAERHSGGRAPTGGGEAGRSGDWLVTSTPAWPAHRAGSDWATPLSRAHGRDEEEEATSARGVAGGPLALAPPPAREGDGGVANRDRKMGDGPARVPSRRGGPVRLVEETPWRWRIDRAGEMRVPGVVFASAELLPAAAADESLQQVVNVAALPGIVTASYAMPDVHWGYGFPIGGVAATDVADGGVVSPGGVGFDISCGVRLLLSPLDRAELAPLLPAVMDELDRLIPKGMGRGRCGNCPTRSCAVCSPAGPATRPSAATAPPGISNAARTAGCSPGPTRRPSASGPCCAGCTRSAVSGRATTFSRSRSWTRSSTRWPRTRSASTRAACA